MQTQANRQDEKSKELYLHSLIFLRYWHRIILDDEMKMLLEIAEYRFGFRNLSYNLKDWTLFIFVKRPSVC